MKTYIITGASSDVGIALLNKLETNEEKIVAYCQYLSNSIELKKLQKRFCHIDIRLFQCNLADCKEISDWIESMNQEDIVPTHIVHLAANRFEYMRLQHFDWSKTVENLTISVNTLAQLFKNYLPIMSKNKYGKIAVMLTAYTIGIPPKFMTDYIVAKYALLGFIRSAASEYSSCGITINGLSPNLMETKFLSNIDKRYIELNARNSNMKRNIGVDEVVDSLLYLLSDATNYMNGVNLNLTGGDRM